MAKKVVAIVLLIAIAAGSYFAFKNHHFTGDSVCGAGFYGLKLLMIYLGIVLLSFLFIWVLVSNKHGKRCISCKSLMDGEWNICPYCGSGNERVDI